MKNIVFRLFATFVLSSLLAACGGGGDALPVVVQQPSAVAHVPSPPIAAVADVTLTQVATALSVTPGETFRATILKVSCPLWQGTTEYCTKPVPLGDIGFEVSVELLDSKVLYNGRVLQGWFSREGSLYRFSPTERVETWQTGSIELVATLSPYAASGEKSLVVVHAVSAAFDKTLELAAGTAKIEVLALPHYAPAIVTSDSPGFVTGNSDMAEVTRLDYACPAKVSQGCTLSAFGVILNGAAEGTEVRLYVAGNWYLQDFVGASGSSNYRMDVRYWVPAGTTISVQVFASMQAGGSVWFNEIKSLSGDKEIAPKLQKECTAASPQNCKG